jgi:hypothetical protein
MKETQQWIAPRQVMENTDFTAWVRGLEDQRAHRRAEQGNHPLRRTAEKAGWRTPRSNWTTASRLFESCQRICRSTAFFPTDGPKSDAWMPLPAVMALSGQDGQTAKPVQTAWNDPSSPPTSQGDSRRFRRRHRRT